MGYLIEAMGGDYGMIFVIAPITLVFAFVFMLACATRRACGPSS